MGAAIASQDTIYLLNGTDCLARNGFASWTFYETTEQSPASLAEVSDVVE